MTGSINTGQHNTAMVIIIIISSSLDSQQILMHLCFTLGWNQPRPNVSL